MKKKKLFTIILFVATAFTFVVCYNDLRMTGEQEMTKVKGEIELLKGKMWQHSEKIKMQLPDSFKLYDNKKKEYTVIQLIPRGARIGLYIDKRQCTSCWEEAVEYMKMATEKTRKASRPFIIAGGYNVREFTLLNQRFKASIPMYYTTEWLPDLEFLTKENKPFYFILESNGTISSVFYPEELYSALGKMYFDTATKKCHYDKPTNKPDKGLQVLNPEIDLGEIGLREKKTAVFKIRNIGDRKCNIRSVTTVCNCTMVESSPQIILPGETGEVKVNFLSTSKGDFSRAIIVKTDVGEGYYNLKIKAKVV